MFDIKMYIYSISFNIFVYSLEIECRWLECIGVCIYFNVRYKLVFVVLYVLSKL